MNSCSGAYDFRDSVDRASFRGAGDHEGQGGAASYLRAISGVVAGGSPLPPPLNFGLSENLLLVRNFSSKNAKFEAGKLLFWGKFRVQIEIMRTHGLLCRTFAAVCRNSVGNFQCLSENCKFLSRLQ